MSDLEDRLREALHDPRRELPAWPDPMPRIRSAARRRRARLAVVALLAAAVAAAAIVAPVLLLRPSTGGGPAVGTATSPPPATSSSSPPPAGWVRRSASGVSIDIPAAWHINSNPVPALADPTILFAIGTGPLPTGGRCGPTASIRAMPADGALFVLYETGSAGEPYTFPPRPERLHLGSLGSGPSECWGVKTYLIPFEDGGRYFQAQAVFGPRATASLRAQVRRSLNTLRVSPLPASQQPTALCRAGQWTSCPQAAWVYEVMNRAHVFPLGSQGTHALIGKALTGTRSFALSTTSRRPRLLNRCRKLAGVRVCRSGAGLAWPAHGLWLLVHPASSPFSGPGIRAGLPDGNVLAQLVRASHNVRMVRL
jgi:hypothetical protein